MTTGSHRRLNRLEAQAEQITPPPPSPPYSHLAPGNPTDEAEANRVTWLWVNQFANVTTSDNLERPHFVDVPKVVRADDYPAPLGDELAKLDTMIREGGGDPHRLREPITDQNELGQRELLTFRSNFYRTIYADGMTEVDERDEVQSVNFHRDLSNLHRFASRFGVDVHAPADVEIAPAWLEGFIGTGPGPIIGGTGDYASDRNGAA